jgi:two-component system, cell cycle sensor histidine kinase and response regulator CckA
VIRASAFPRPADTHNVSPSHSIVRRLVPRFVCAFLAIGILRWTGQWLGLYPNTVGVAIATSSGIAVSVTLILWAGRSLDRTDQLLREADERFRGAFDSAAIGMALVSPEGHFVEVNRSLCELVGYSEEELLALTFQDITHPDDLATDLAYLRETIAGERSSYRMEKRYLRKDGRVVWILLSVSLVRDEHGEPLHFVSQVEDVTERREAGERVAEAERRYRTLVEQLPLVSYVRPRDLTAANSYVSPQVDALLGTSPEEWQTDGDLFLKLVHPEDRDRVVAAAQRFRSTGEPFREEYRYVARDGRVVWVHDESYLLEGLHGGDGGVQGFLIDITERRRAEEDRTRLEGELRHAQKLDAIGRLAGGVAHDFNNILTAVTGYSELMLERLDPVDELYGHAEEIRRSAAQAGSLTRQLLAFGRKQLLQPSPVDPNQVVRSAARLLRSLVGERHTLRVDCAPEPRTVLADPGQIEHAVVNLVLNARDAMPAGGEIGLETSLVDVTGDDAPEGLAAGRYVVLAVSDTGVGMDDETRARAFEPFFTTKPAGAGSGLGLSTAYGVATQSGGTIVAESEAGRGSTVALYLPWAPRLQAVGETESAGAVASRHATVLVAEDRDVVRNLVVSVLEREGLHVLAAADGERALALAASHDGTIDLLLTDVVMPGLDGDELAERVHAQRPGTAVLFMSGYTEREAIRRGAADGDVAFIEKPFRPQELVEKVYAVLGDEQLRAAG